MSRFKRLTAAGIALLLAACASGPEYRTPAPLLAAEAPFVSGAEPAFTAAAPPGDWWRLYQTPAMEGLVGEALAANREIVAAQANLRRVRTLLSESRAGRLPGTELTGSAVRSRLAHPVTGGAVEDTAVTAGFEVAYELDLFGRVGRGVEAARADAEAAAADLGSVRIAVVGETARAYVDVCAANAQIAAAERAIALQHETYRLTERLLEAGRGTGLDVASAAAQLETTRSVLPPLRAKREAALFRLAVLTGRTPGMAPAEVRACGVIPEVTHPIPVGDGAQLLRRRPDVSRAERRVAAATARIGVATADLYPRVTLGGSLATSDASGGFGDTVQFSLGPLISWSFPNLAAARARVRQADASADVALAQFEQATLAALQETETALARYARELDRRAALLRARDAGARAVELVRLRQAAGADSLLNVLIAEQRLVDLELQLARSRAQTADSQITVFKALGGTWGGP